MRPEVAASRELIYILTVDEYEGETSPTSAWSTSDLADAARERLQKKTAWNVNVYELEIDTE